MPIPQRYHKYSPVIDSVLRSIPLVQDERDDIRLWRERVIQQKPQQFKSALMSSLLSTGVRMQVPVLVQDMDIVVELTYQKVLALLHSQES